MKGGFFEKAATRKKEKDDGFIMYEFIVYFIQVFGRAMRGALELAEWGVKGKYRVEFVGVLRGRKGFSC